MNRHERVWWEGRKSCRVPSQFSGALIKIARKLAAGLIHHQALYGSLFPALEYIIVSSLCTLKEKIELAYGGRANFHVGFGIEKLTGNTLFFLQRINSLCLN